MNINIIKKIIPIFILITIFSCDSGHQITDTIINNSDKRIKITSNAFGADNTEIIIEPNSKFVNTNSRIGGFKAINNTEFCPCVSEVTVSITTIDTNFKIIKDFKNANNWERTKKRKFYNRGFFTCKFTIEQNDIVPK
jgi:hypothetical protein